MLSNDDTPIDFSRESEERRAYVERLKQRGPITSGGYLIGQDAETVRYDRGLTIANLFEEQTRRDLEIRAARDLATGEAGRAKYRSEYEEYKRQIGEGS